MKQPSNDPRIQFLETFKRLSSTRHPRTVFGDFVAMAACAISNACDKSQFTRREEMYLNIAKGYSRQELEAFSELLAYTALALEQNSNQDFLGKIFMELNLGNAKTGQFLTPYHMSCMMAKMVGGTKDEFNQKGIITVSDCCCGTGGMLIAHANVTKEEGINYQQRVLYHAQDIDPTMAYACYVQLSLLGCMAQIAIGDALSKPLPEREAIWLTPLCFINEHLLIENKHAKQRVHSGDNGDDLKAIPDNLSLAHSTSGFFFFMFESEAS